MPMQNLRVAHKLKNYIEWHNKKKPNQEFNKIKIRGHAVEESLYEQIIFIVELALCKT